jgi:hypothetical protein
LRVARSEWTKIRSLRSTLWTFLVTAVLTIGLGSLFALGRTSSRDPIPASFNAAGFPFNGLFLAQLARLLGAALGALLRSTAAAITTLAGLLFILPILMNFLPVSWHRDAIGQWLPSATGMQIVEKVTPSLMFSPWAGLAVFAGWVAVAFVTGLVLLRRRDT